MASLHGSFTIDVPRERIPILIGHNGEVKARIERELGIRLKISSDLGVAEVQLAKPVSEGGDPVALFKAKSVVQAIASGFNPEKAMKLVNDDYTLTVIDLTEHLGKKSEDLRRVKARIIGSNGRTRKIIEENAHVDVSIYGNSVAIIGRPQDVAAAEEAVMMLVRGTPHSAVYRFLDNYAQRRRLTPTFY